MRTAVWLYLFSFIAIFDLHAQYPILTPFAVSLGAAPSFIGLMMGMYSITHLPGNVIAGWSVDRFGSRVFIVLSLLGAGVILLLQSRVDDPWQLLVLRSISGFVLAFLSPACMALLAKITADRILQGKLMAGNGLVHTLASVVSPAAGALLVARLGFELSFFALGWVLIGTSICALLFIRDIRPPAADGTAGHAGTPGPHGATGATTGLADTYLADATGKPTFPSGKKISAAPHPVNPFPADKTTVAHPQSPVTGVFHASKLGAANPPHYSAAHAPSNAAHTPHHNTTHVPQYGAAHATLTGYANSSQHDTDHAPLHGAAHAPMHGTDHALLKGAANPPRPGDADDLPLPWLVYALPIAMSCAQGILSFELPLLALHDHSIMQTGLLFSVLSLGSLVTLSMMFLNRFSSLRRTMAGALTLALAYFTAAVGELVPLTALLFIIGMAKGVIYPALSTLLIELTGSAKYGRTFSVLSIAYSVGAFLGPLVAGYIRDAISPYFIAFLVLMTGVILLPFAGPRRLHTASPRIG